MINGRESQTVKAMGLGAILASNIFLFVPFTLYVGNLDEFIASFSTILAFYIRPAIFLVAAFGLIGAFLTESAFRRYLILLGAISVLLWAQGNMLVWEYGLMNGRGIDWAQDTWRGWIDLGVWFGVILIAIVFHRRIGRPIVYLAVATFSLQLIAALVVGIQNRPALAEKADKRFSVDALTDMQRMSSRKNVLHIILDGFQSDVFEEIVSNREDGMRFRTALKGFVFFRENMGVFPYTHMTVPALLSGRIYRNHVPTHRFIDKTIGGKTILNAAHNAGYEIDLAGPALLVGMYAKGSYTNAYNIPVNSHVTTPEYERNDSAKLLDLALFRLVPHFLKRHVYNDQLWLVQSLISDSKYMQLQFFSHNAFLRQIKDNMSADRSTPVYKLFHLMLSHEPIVANENCEYAGRVLPTVRATVKIQAKCSLIEVISLLEKMKELDIYDDAMIILQADHGAWVQPAGLVGDGKPIVMTIRDVAQALPLMAIKRPRANGPLQMSLAPTSILDTPATVASVLRLNEKFDGTSIFDLRPDELRERRTYTYDYSRSEWTIEYLNPIQEFIVSGSVFDTATWRRGDRFLPNGIVKKK